MSEIDKLRKQLNQLASKNINKLTQKKIVNISQKLDILIVEEQKRKQGSQIKGGTKN